MFANNRFYHSLTRKYISLFGMLFNDIIITRDTSETVRDTQMIKVPVAYGPRQKFLARLMERPNQDRVIATNLPKISFEINSFEYASERKIGRTNLATAMPSGANARFLTGRQPWDIGFELNIYTTTVTDLMKIIEQIIPYFDPEWSLSAQLLDDFPNEILDIPVILNSVDFQDVYQGDFEERRVVTAKLTFTMQVYYFGPVKQDKIIKIVDVNFYTKDEMATVAESLTVQPGLTADGLPTNKIEETIPYIDIDGDDNYDYIVTFRDGKREE